MKALFRLTSRANRIFLALYILWLFFNFTLLLIWGSPSGKGIIKFCLDGSPNVQLEFQDGTTSHFYPFIGNIDNAEDKWFFCDPARIKFYDYTEFIVYCLAPIIILIVSKLLLPIKQEPTET